LVLNVGVLVLVLDLSILFMFLVLDVDLLVLFLNLSILVMFLVLDVDLVVLVLDLRVLVCSWFGMLMSWCWSWTRVSWSVLGLEC